MKKWYFSQNSKDTDKDKDKDTLRKHRFKILVI